MSMMQVACDRCTQGVMDTTNPHLTGTCGCECHRAAGEASADAPGPPSALTFTAYGLPQPAGSKRAFQHRHTGRIVVTDAAKGSRAWKQEVASAARAAMPADDDAAAGPLLDGPLVLGVVFYLPRPRSHFGARGLRPSAPEYPATRPDATKLLRAVEDALTGVIWRDDAQIVQQSVLKVYGEPARCEVAITPL